MGSEKTISDRYRDWTETSLLDNILSRVALVSFLTAMVGLFVHLLVLHGAYRTAGLYTLIGGDIVTLTITGFRARKVQTVWWWFWFFVYITVGVIAFELASYFFGH